MLQFLFMLFAGPVFSTLGGLLGAAIFRKPAPPLVPGVSMSPPPPSTLTRRRDAGCGSTAHFRAGVHCRDLRYPSDNDRPQIRRIRRSPPRRPHISTASRVPGDGPRPRRDASTPRPNAIPRRSGPGLPASSNGPARGTASSTGSRRTRNGSSAARSTRASTASTATSRDRAATRPRSSGKASRAIGAR